MSMLGSKSETVNSPVKEKKLVVVGEDSKEQLELNRKLITLILQNKNDDTISTFIETSGVDINYFTNEYNPLFQLMSHNNNNDGNFYRNLKILANHNVNFNIVWRNNDIPLFELAKMESGIRYIKIAKNSGANMYQIDKKGRNLLMFALECRADFKLIKYLFSLRYNLSQQDIDGNTVYMYATIYHNVNTYNKVLPYLLKNFIYNPQIITSLILMGKHKQPASNKTILQIIKRNNELINIKNNDGDSALFIAIKSYRQQKIISYLFQLGAKMDDVDNEGNSTLMIATIARNYSTFRYLLPLQSDLNYKNKHQDTALIIAAKSNDCSMVRLLLNYCPTPNTETVSEKEKKRNNFLRSISTKFFEELKLSTNENVDDLHIEASQKHLNINEQNEDGETAFTIAIAKKNREMIYNMALCGADPRLANNKKETPLIIAVKTGNEKVVGLILDILEGNEASINDMDENQETALMIAIKNSYTSIALRILSYPGIDLTLRDKEDCTALMIAASRDTRILQAILSNHQDTLQYRDKNGNTALFLSIRSKVIANMKLLLGAGARYDDLDLKKNTPLIIAAKVGAPIIVNYLCAVKKDFNIDVNAQNDHGNTALMKAVKSGMVMAVQELLQNGANIEMRNHKGNNALIIGCLQGNINVIKELLKHGASLDCSNNEGMTPASISCSKVELAELLIRDNHAQVNYEDKARNDQMIQSFVKAIEEGRYKVVKILLQNNFTMDLSVRNSAFYQLLSALIVATNTAQYKILNEIFSRKDIFQPVLEAYRTSTVLITACRNTKKKTIQLLLRLGVDVNVRDEHGNTALIEACKSPYLYSVVEELLKKNAEINAANDEGVTALFNSCKIQDFKIFKLLLCNKANAYHKDIEGNNALMYACSYTQMDKVKFLVKMRKMVINAANHKGDTALIESIRYGRNDIAKYLIKHKADVNHLNNKNQSALVIGFLKAYEVEEVEYKYLSILKYLIDKKANPNLPIDATGNTILMFLIMKNDVDMIKYLIKISEKSKMKLDLNQKNHLGHNAYTYALKCNNHEIIDIFFLNKSIYKRFDFHTEDDYGNDMIMYSACALSGLRREHFQKLIHSLPKDALNHCNHQRETYLIMAAKVNNERIIDILLHHGANVDAQDAQGNTALHFAALQGNVGTIKKLIDAKASLEILNFKQETPLMVACRFKQREAIHILMDLGALSFFVDNVIFKKEKSFKFQDNPEHYIDLMIEYYHNISDLVPDNYMPTTTLLERMQRFYKPAVFKERFEVEEQIFDGLEELIELCVDTITGAN